MGQQQAVIIGAGPAGLTAALELIRTTNIRPIVLEASSEVGGISRTVCHNGNRMDLGGHRFFSKSDWVMNWWQEILPIDAAAESSLKLTYQNKQTSVQVAGNALESDDDRRMLVRSRLSRIFFLRRFFDYPIKMNAATASKLGLWRLTKVALTYGWITLFPRTPEKNLEDFMINRFGRELYETFFKDYTHKVWGIPCDQISADWGAQRIKGLNISKALWHALKQVFKSKGGVAQKGTETSLIEQFLYPKFGPGQMWQEVARMVTEGGGEIRYQQAVTGVETRDGKVVAVRGTDHASGQPFRLECSHAISTMPVRELIKGMDQVPPEVRQVADGLMYRDFLTVGLLVRKADVLSTGGQALPDNWIYIQEKDVRIGRLQIFNNWSPHLVQDEDTMWLGLEYFCNEDDDLWRMDDAAMIAFGAAELHKIGMLNNTNVLDGTVVRVPKAYPAYFGSYAQFDVVRRYTDTISNLFLVGRNGMHRYNNQDHSMLTAKLAVEAIASGATSKDQLWDVNIDDEYHEEKK
ncbi:NAD(P)/FAD-dependent oxidoreductase [Pseudoduganella sp. OTU4001]|uniref:NAD(P)/FAD-dependent oxidoreductase n=1 Tax=Pseudoduganella sp. OTU4001 TaxID=3043854 RepID=UPI00313C64E9